MKHAFAPSALPGLSLLTRRNLYPASVGEPFHSHRAALCRRSVTAGCRSPMRPRNGVGFKREAPGFAASGNASGTPFVSDCLSPLQRRLVAALEHPFRGASL